MTKSLGGGGHGMSVGEAKTVAADHISEADNVLIE